MFDQIQRDISHNMRNNEICFALMLAADMAAIYFLWNFGIKKAQLNTALVPKTGSHV